MRLSRKTGRAEAIQGDDGEMGSDNPLAADADRRRKEWEEQQAKAAASH